MWPQDKTENIPQVLLPVGRLGPEDTQPNALGGESQYTNGLVVSGLPQVDPVDLKQRETDITEGQWRCGFLKTFDTTIGLIRSVTTKLK